MAYKNINDLINKIEELETNMQTAGSAGITENKDIEVLKKELKLLHDKITEFETTAFALASQAPTVIEKVIEKPIETKVIEHHHHHKSSDTKQQLLYGAYGIFKK